MNSRTRHVVRLFSEVPRYLALAFAGAVTLFGGHLALMLWRISGLSFVLAALAIGTLCWQAIALRNFKRRFMDEQSALLQVRQDLEQQSLELRTLLQREFESREEMMVDVEAVRQRLISLAELRSSFLERIETSATNARFQRELELAGRQLEKSRASSIRSVKDLQKMNDFLFQLEDRLRKIVQ